jgi:shikimate kinase
LDKNTIHIVLVGLPGSGKSTVGKALASRLDRSFQDLDTIIAEEEGMSIPEIFTTHGEGYFREQEALWLRNTLSEKKGIVLATGGGAPCFHENMDLILAESLSVYLEVPFELLAERLFTEGVEKRPLLEGINNPKGLVHLLEEKFAYRIPFYQKAGLHFRNTADASVEELVGKLQALNKFE